MPLYKKVIVNLLFAILLVFGFTIAFAQKPLIFKHITVDNGLSQNRVMSILQDRGGMVWLGTYDGLSKFDGITFNILKNQPGDPSTLNSNQVDKLFEDAQGNLWVCTVDGINRYDRLTEKFTRFYINSSRSKYIVQSMVQDENGVIWAASDDGLIEYDSRHQDPSSNIFERSKIISGEIKSLYIDDAQHMWIGTAQALKIYDLRKKAFVSIPNALQQTPQVLNTIIRSIIQDNTGNYWIGTETEGLFYYNVKAGTCVNYNKHNGLLSNTVRALLQAEKNTVWVGTKDGLNTINITDHQVKAYQHDPENTNTLSNNSVRCIVKDKEGNIWIGTHNGGVNVVYRSYDNFYHLGLKMGASSGLSYGVVNAILEDKNSSLWIGTDEGGLNFVDSARQVRHVYYTVDGKHGEFLGSSIKAIASQPNNRSLWIGTGTGLKSFDKETKKFTDLDLIDKPKIKGLIQNYAFARYGAGLWAGTNFRGLYYIEGNKVLHHFQVDSAKAGGIISNNINTLLVDGDLLWIGTKESGLCCLNIKSQTFRSYPVNTAGVSGLTNGAVLSIFKDAQGRLWIGTDGGGLDLLDTRSDRFYHINENTGLLNNTIYGILEDNVGRLWVSTNKGLAGITFNKFKVPFNAADLYIANYTVEDGLQSNQFTIGAAKKTSNDQLIFGGINGLTIFVPERIKINSTKPAIIFTDLSILNKPVKFGDNSPLKKPINETSEITLNYNQAFFTIKFAALSYIDPQKNKFAFKLEGFSDDAWHDVGDQQTATYTNLDPGTYFFKLVAANNDGIWNNTPKVLKIVILPPWYKTWTAYFIYCLIFAGILYLFNKYSRKTARLKAQLEFESISHIKDQELAQKKLSFFMNISHEIKTPLTMVTAPIERLIKLNQGNNKMHNQLVLMQRNSERLIRLINQLLDIRKFESGSTRLQAAEGDIVQFVKEVSLAFDNLARSKNIDLIVKAEEEEINLWFDRDKLEKVIYNLLSNALKFTPAFGTVTLRVGKRVAHEEKYGVIAVEDNGCGIAPQDLAKLFNQFYHDEHHYSNDQGTGLGLAFAKDLVELHHGEISVESRPENGAERGYTCFEVELPLGDRHLKNDEVIENFRNGEDINAYHQTEKTLQKQFSARKARILDLEGRGKLNMLIVEDNHDVLNFVKTCFEEDFEILTADNGLDGCSLAQANIPDIIISDVMMPKMDGIELCRTLRSDMATSHIPIILLTARTAMIFKIEGLETGADDYVTKPFNFGILEARVWNLIENRQILRTRYQKEIMLEPQNIAISDMDERFLNKVLSYIETHMDDPDLSVEQLSREVAMSRNTFTKKVKALTNQTGLDFIRNIKLKRAAQLLSLGQLHVNEVAYMVGFSDVNYFRKCFKELFGYTPKEQNVIIKETPDSF